MLFTQGTTGIAYSVGTIANATSYTWSYSGTGTTIHGTTAGVTIDFSAAATAGTLTVAGNNSCGNGVPSSLILNPNNFLNLKVFLDGPFNLGAMNATLNPALIPLAQPYGNVVPWNNTGTESVTTFPAGVLDWIFVEVRQAATAALATSATILIKRACFLKLDGTIVDLDGTSQLNIGHPVITSNLFIVIRHRNHLAIMTATSPTLNNTVYSYDFTTSLAQAYLGGTGYRQIGSAPVKYGMVIGDDNNDGGVTILDYNQWALNYNKTNGYYNSDLNFDGSVTVLDYNKWALNYNAVNNSNLKSASMLPVYFSTVPK